MAFRFSLLNILRLRGALERQEEQKLILLAGDVARLRSTIESLDEGQLLEQCAALKQLAEGSVGAELQFANLCLTAYDRARKQRMGELQVAEARRLEQMQAYREARQKRETLDGLRERQETAYILESTRREQQRADELFLLRMFCEGSDQNLPSGAARSAQSGTL